MQRTLSYIVKGLRPSIIFGAKQSARLLICRHAASLSSSAFQQQIRSALRKLYLRVHPDLFGSHPEVKVDND